MLPKDWQIRLINRNTEELTDADIEWADLVMIGGMLNQQPDFLYLIDLDAPAQQGQYASAARTSRPARISTRTADFKVIGEVEHIIEGLDRRVGARRARGRVHGREIQGRHHAEPAAALRPAQARALPLHRRPVLARLPVHLRVLRHHRAVRPRAAHQDQRPDARRAAGASTTPAIAAMSTSSTTTSSATASTCSLMMPMLKQWLEKHDYPFEFYDRSLDQHRRRRRHVAGDEGRELHRASSSASSPGSRDAGPDAEEAEHQAQHRREHPQDLRLRHVRDRGLHPRASTPRRLSIATVDDRLHRGDAACRSAWSAYSTRCPARS